MYNIKLMNFLEKKVIFGIFLSFLPIKDDNHAGSWKDPNPSLIYMMAADDGDSFWINLWNISKFAEQPRDDLLPEAEQAAGGQDRQEPRGGGGQVHGQAASNHLQGTIQKVRSRTMKLPP